LPQALKLGRRLLHACGRRHVVTQGDERAPLHFKSCPDAANGSQEIFWHSSSGPMSAR